MTGQFLAVTQQDEACGDNMLPRPWMSKNSLLPFLSLAEIVVVHWMNYHPRPCSELDSNKCRIVRESGREKKKNPERGEKIEIHL